MGQILGIDIFLEDMTTGVSGFQLPVSIQDPAMARILDVQFPDYSDPVTGFELATVTGALPGSSITITVLDLSGRLQSPLPSTVLATLNIEFLDARTTQIVVSESSRLDDDSGNILTFVTVSGTLTASPAS
ncbi:MAG: hypothetical protein O7E55_01445 [Chloroflexi bacterium]|nr:hypothetical protein [Chloroflexota bacterium]